MRKIFFLLKPRRARIAWALLLLALLIAVAPSGALGREVVDMAGRKVELPEILKKVYGASPPITNLLYAMDPACIAGSNYPFRPEEARWLRAMPPDLPVLGGWFGQGRTPNQEALLKVRPDVMVVWMWTSHMANQKIAETADKLGLPYVYVRMDQVADYVESFRFMGKLLGKEERGNALSDYARKTLEEVSPIVTSIPRDKRVSVYYAEAPDGLSTECDKSMHTELIELSGGRNVYSCAPKDDFGMERISLEQVMLEDPEVILVQEKDFFDQVSSDPRWQGIRAVKNKKVYLIPRGPFNWFDRPPSFMRLLGVKWLVNILYPDRYPIDIEKETKDFYHLFLGLDLDDKAVREVLNP